MTAVRAAINSQTIRLLALIVAPVWGAGLYVAQSTSAVLEAQIQACAARESVAFERSEAREQKLMDLIESLLDGGDKILATPDDAAEPIEP